MVNTSPASSHLTLQESAWCLQQNSVSWKNKGAAISQKIAPKLQTIFFQTSRSLELQSWRKISQMISLINFTFILHLPQACMAKMRGKKEGNRKKLGKNCKVHEEINKLRREV